jgi:hypothetical protein
MRKRGARRSWQCRFHASYQPEPNSGCWIWTDYTTPDGYGNFAQKVGDRHLQRNAHRVSWELHCGPIPDGVSVLHRCDMRPCVNPDHLFLGTQLDNMRDCARKGRYAHQKDHFRPAARLSPDDIRMIMASSLGGTELGKMLGVVKGTVRAVRSGMNWRHITGLEKPARKSTGAA